MSVREPGAMGAASRTDRAAYAIARLVTRRAARGASSGVVLHRVNGRLYRHNPYTRKGSEWTTWPGGQGVPDPYIKPDPGEG